MNKFKLDPLLQSELRFFIMSILALNEEVDFNYLKTELEASSGNLSVSLRKLEDAKYIIVKKSFMERKPRTSYTITKIGLKVLSSHLDTMDSIKSILDKNNSEVKDA